MNSVTITKSDDGTFTVSSGAAMGGEQSEGGQPAKSLQDALLLAARMLEKPADGGGMSPFDKGMQKAMPAGMSMGNMSGM